jgi:hypothetical protein
MKAIGGYFELELNNGVEYHPDALKLNLGRTAFEYILNAKFVAKIYMPFYACNALHEPVTKSGTEVEFYHINAEFEPEFNFDLLEGTDFFIYINYFGIKDRYINGLAKKVNNLIIDNSQAFYSKPIPGADTFYSPRKFFGVPDGGYLYTDKVLARELSYDNSSDRIAHLIGRIENGPEESFKVYKSLEEGFSGKDIMRMSKTSERLLQNINYDKVAKTRKENFEYLDINLKSRNKLKFNISGNSVPMIYPLLTEDRNLHQKLIDKKIYVAKYWKEVKTFVSDNDNEAELVDYLVPLPIDQRYELKDMERMVKTLLKYV